MPEARLERTRRSLPPDYRYEPTTVAAARVRCPECLGLPCDCDDPDWDADGEGTE